MFSVCQAPPVCSGHFGQAPHSPHAQKILPLTATCPVSTLTGAFEGLHLTGFGEKQWAAFQVLQLNDFLEAKAPGIRLRFTSALLFSLRWTSACLRDKFNSSGRMCGLSHHQIAAPKEGKLSDLHQFWGYQSNGEGKPLHRLALKQETLLNQEWQGTPLWTC